MRQVATVLISSSLACAAWLAAAVALAQTAPASSAAAAPAGGTTVATVTVQAAAKPKQVEQQTRTFVQGYAAAPNPEVGQIARWHDPVCVQVVGLPGPDQAKLIKARIESVAQAVGLPAAHANCVANVEVAFSETPQAIMDVVAERREFLLGYYHLHDRDRLKKVRHPIQAWYVTATRGEGTGTVALAETPFTAFSESRMEVVDDPRLQPPNGCAGSRIGSNCYKSLLRNVFIVADSRALDGKEVGLVADEMALLALSQPRSLDGCSVLPSVIDAFAKAACSGRDPPNGLTPADAAYLSALYSFDLRARKASEQSGIAGRMAKMLIKANAPAH